MARGLGIVLKKAKDTQEELAGRRSSAQGMERVQEEVVQRCAERRSCQTLVLETGYGSSIDVII